MYFIDVKFLRMVSCRLEGFVQKTQDLFNFRCPFCNDSKKTLSKKRGYLYRKGNHLFFRCHNCGESTNFYKFIKYIDPSLAKEYQLEQFKTKNNTSKLPSFKHEIPVFDIKSDIKLPKLSNLSDDNIAKQYLISRQIPKKYYSDLYYSEDFKNFVLDICPQYTKELIENDSRLIIPFRNQEGTLIMFQGRSLSNNKRRYITIKLIDDALKLFGLNKISLKSPIKIVEGPLDALCLINAIATADSNLESGANYFKNHQTVLIPDKQPRNSEITNLISKFIKNNHNVCLLPNELPGKDINEMIINGISFTEMEEIINKNTFTGLRASLEFDKWRKI